MNNHGFDQLAKPAEFPQAIHDAAQRIAPAWPLDNAIAVNPWWELRNHKFSDVAARLETLGHAKCLMDKAFYREQWQKTIQAEHLSRAVNELGGQHDINSLLAFLDSDDVSMPHWHNFSELLDALPEHAKKMPWHDEIQQQISQFCGLFFQYGEHMQPSANESTGLYTAWLDVARSDKGIEVLMGEHGLHEQFIDLPDCPRQLCEMVMQSFNSPDNFADYGHALLLDIHGWASYLAYCAWQDNFSNIPNTMVEQLLAIRLAWEWVLWRNSEKRFQHSFKHLQARFLQQFELLPSFQEQHQLQQEKLWFWQKALELSYQSQLQCQLLANTQEQPDQPPKLQAAFCIDVRSEPMRRALEAQDPAIETLGFAGFFGLPLEYAPEGSSYARAQLPGLLKPVIQATQKNIEANSKSTAKQLAHLQRQESAFEAAPSSLGLVEMLGFFKAGSLLKNSLWPSTPEHSINDLCDDRPFELSCAGKAIDLDSKVNLAADILNNMGITKRFAPTVLLLGHGSCSANNPQAASLDCGACGGQTGEVNVKVLAQLLNDTQVRNALGAKGIAIPSTTQFVAGLHNTTTDEIICYGEFLPELSTPEWQEWLEAATRQAQQQRAASLDIPVNDKLSADYQRRSENWAELRPEWGLANNAAFIVAPRALTRNINLEGRSFLHDYHWQDDKQFSILELIMTAPMIVTNWINLQYYASVVDNRLYGSGNKLLHNVVGDHIGVFEGNGGDLRIGLSIQSLHDGKQWRHQPQRLGVYIAAPRDAIANIVDKHEAVAQLINNDWLYLFQIDTQEKSIARYYQGNFIA